MCVCIVYTNVALIYIRYQKVIKRNSCVVELQTERSEFGEIQFFIGPEGESVMALELFDVQSSPFLCPRLQKFILLVKRSNTIVVRSVKLSRSVY